MKVIAHSLTLFALACLALSLVLEFRPAAAQTAPPTTIILTAGMQTVRVGSTVTFHLSLVDPNQNPANAVKNTRVSIEMQLPSGKLITKEVYIRSGTNSETFEMVVPEAGVIRVRAMERHLLEGGTLLYAVPSSSVTPSRALLWRETLTANLSSLKSSRFSVEDIKVAATRQKTIRTVPTITSRSTLLQASGAPPSLLQVKLYCSPARDLLANGKDFATITAIPDDVLGTVPDVDVSVHLHTTIGTLDPNPIVIHKAAHQGMCKLTSNQVGTAEIRCDWSEPPIDSKDTLKVRFAPPISSLSIDVSPPSVSMLDLPSVSVKLVDENRQNIPTDKDKQVRLNINQGSGAFSPEVLTIHRNAFEEHSTFMPMWPGEVSAEAESDNIPVEAFHLDVNFPFSTLAVAVVGGLAGGLVTSLRRKRAPWRLLVVGVFTGPLIYLVFLFPVLPGIPNLPRPMLQNPLATLAIAFCGGLIGPEIFALSFGLLKRRRNK